MKKTLLVLPVALVCASLPVVHAQADPAESGCFDIAVSPNASAASWDRLLESIEQSGDGSLIRPYSKAEPVFKGTGITAAEIQLAAASCIDVSYRATISRAVPAEGGGFTAGPVLTELAARGDGVRSRVSLRGILDLEEDCVQVVLTTSNPGGKVVDRSPDKGEVTVCNGGSGGQTFGS